MSTGKSTLALKWYSTIGIKVNHLIRSAVYFKFVFLIFMEEYFRKIKAKSFTLKTRFIVYTNQSFLDASGTSVINLTYSDYHY